MRTFDEVADEAGLSKDTGQGNFLKWKVPGFWVIGEVSNRRSLPEYRTKEGKRIKEQEAVNIDIRDCSDESIIGRKMSMSLSGLLAYQLFEAEEAPKILPYVVGISYTGKDEEGRNQTRVRYFQPSKKVAVAA